MPFLSVVTRSCGRAKQFARAKKSLMTQIDPDYEHIVIVDTVGRGLHVANKSLNLNKHRVKGQYVFILDDDNYVSDRNFIKHLKNVVSQHKVDIILFKAHRKPFSETLPSKRVWGTRPILGEIDSCCFVVKRAVWQKHIHEFGQPKHGDYHFIKTLFDKGYSRYWVSKTMVMIPTIGGGKCLPSKVVVSPRVDKKTKVVASPKVGSVYAQVTVVLTNYCTKALTEEALRTMLLYYPQIPLILIDNGSKDDSTEYIRAVGKKHTNITVVLNEHNLGHGPAMNLGIRLAKTPFVFLYDSDASLRRAGILEAMLAEFEKNPKKLYAIGWLRNVDKFSGVPMKVKGMRYIHPHAAMIDRGKFLGLTPMENSGAPCTGNMRAALARGYQLKSFPLLQEYIKHLIAGTRRRFGGCWKPGARKPRAWKSKDCYPI